MSATQQVHRGMEGSQAFLKNFIGGIPFENILLVHDPVSLKASGAGNWLASSGGPFPVFNDFAVNPKEDDLLRGLRIFNDNHIQAIIAIGGGSAMDMAKLINYFGSNNLTLDDALSGAAPTGLTTRPLLAVPTTSGTGSEATHFAVVYRNRQKYSIADALLRPSHVALIPEFTFSVPPYITACTGMDALAQGIESGWARGATDESRGYSTRAVEAAMSNLEAAVCSPAPENRAAMMEAAHLAGKGIDITKTTAPHAYSYILTSEFNLPHGHAVALLLPYFIDFHRQAGISVIGDLTGADILSLMARINLPQTLPASADTLFRLLMDNVNLERLGNNPVPVTPELIRAIAENISAPAS